MSLGLGRAARRRRQRRILLISIGCFCVLAALGVFAYVSGSTLAERELVNLRAELQRLQRLLEAERTEQAQLRVDRDLAQTRASEWQARYEREVPSGPQKKLLALVREQLAAGVAADRLVFMIKAAANADNCDGEPVTKRFLVRTPIYSGANDSVGFADGAVTVTANGDSAVNADGKQEAWFDSDQSVTVRFTALGGESSQISGILPLHHSIVLNDAEYRFTIVQGENRGFVNVTADRCRFGLD